MDVRNQHCIRYTPGMNIIDDRNDTRPAIETDPLPQPGESLRDEIHRLTTEELGPWISLLLLALVYPALEWYRYVFRLQITIRSGIVVSILGGIVVAYALRRLFKVRTDFRNLAKGLRGEQHVGHYLHDFCCPLNYRVLHDIPANDFNIDHLLIGPGGIFVIETKNWSLPPKGTKATLIFNGTTLTKPDGSFDTHLPAQAHANADFICNLVARRTARDPNSIRVHPVLLFPGWYINDRTPKPRRALWIFGNNTLHKWLPNEPPHLSDPDIALFYESLAEYTRNFQK